MPPIVPYQYAFSGGGSAAGTGAASSIGPLALGLAAFGGITSGIGAYQQNKAIKRATELSLDRLDDFITQNRVDKILNTERLARDATVELGAVLNVAPEGLSVMETIASRIVGGVAMDQFTIEEEARRREVAAMADKENVVAQANSQMQSPVLAGISGAIGGASQGVQLGGALDSITQAGEFAAAQAAADAFQIQREGETSSQQSILGQQAIQQGEANLRIGQARLAELALRRSYYANLLRRQYGQMSTMQNNPFMLMAERVFMPFILPRAAQ